MVVELAGSTLGLRGPRCLIYLMISLLLMNPLFPILEAGGPVEGKDGVLETRTIDRWDVPVVHDESRLYASLLGHEFAIDLATGQLVWRSGRFDVLPENLSRRYLVSPERYHLTLADGELWSVTCDVATARSRSNQAVFHLSCRDTGTGRQLFRSDSREDLKGWSFNGAPICAGERVYVPASNPS